MSHAEGSTEEEPSSSTNLPLIIGISCGAIVIVAVITIFVIFHCKRTALRSSNFRVGDSMPTEEDGSKHESYQLNPTYSAKDEDVTLVKEKGTSNEAIE